VLPAELGSCSAPSGSPTKSDRRRATPPPHPALHDSGEADGLLFYVIPSSRRSLPRTFSGEALSIASHRHRAADRHGAGHAPRPRSVHDHQPENILPRRGGDGDPTSAALAVGAAPGAAHRHRLMVGTPEYISPSRPRQTDAGSSERRLQPRLRPLRDGSRASRRTPGPRPSVIAKTIHRTRCPPSAVSGRRCRRPWSRRYESARQGPATGFTSLPHWPTRSPRCRHQPRSRRGGAPLPQPERRPGNEFFADGSPKT